MHIPQVTGIIRRADQGATRPFICRADDGNIYYVKGKSASTGERIREWMGAMLATAFGLRVPRMAILDVPEFLIRSSTGEIKTELGAGYAVGSQQILSVSELRHEEISLISVDEQREVLVFDYWIRNEDRTLSKLGGNPNLLWNRELKSLYAIDYNLILQRQFDNQMFWTTHAFAKSAALHEMNGSEREALQHRLHKSLGSWPEYWQQLPDEWLDENELIAAFVESDVLKQLQDDASGKIWSSIKP